MDVTMLEMYANGMRVGTHCVKKIYANGKGRANIFSKVPLDMLSCKNSYYNYLYLHNNQDLRSINSLLFYTIC